MLRPPARMVTFILEKCVTLRVREVLQVFQATGVAEQVERYDLDRGLGLQKIANEVRADETRSAGDEVFLHQKSYSRMAAITRCWSSMVREL